MQVCKRVIEKVNSVIVDKSISLDLNYKLPKVKGDFKGDHLPSYYAESGVLSYDTKTKPSESQHAIQNDLITNSVHDMSDAKVNANDVILLEGENGHNDIMASSSDTRINSIESTDQTILPNTTQEIYVNNHNNVSAITDAGDHSSVAMELLNNINNDNSHTQIDSNYPSTIQSNMEDSSVKSKKSKSRSLEVKPWLVMKTRRLDERKVFINMCYHSEIPRDEIIVSVDSPREVTDNKGELSSVYDVGVSADVHAKWKDSEGRHEV
jgi:hypothetical protein